MIAGPRNLEDLRRIPYTELAFARFLVRALAEVTEPQVKRLLAGVVEERCRPCAGRP
jgi:hypothetical protein